MDTTPRSKSCGSQSRAGRSHPRRRPATRRSSFPASLAPARSCLSQPTTTYIAQVLAYSSSARLPRAAIAPPLCAFLRTPGRFILFRLVAETVESPLKASARGRASTGLRPAGPHVPWTGKTYVLLRQPIPLLLVPFSVRAPDLRQNPLQAATKVQKFPKILIPQIYNRLHISAKRSNERSKPKYKPQ